MSFLQNVSGTQQALPTLLEPQLAPAPGWYAAHVHSNFEKRVAAELSVKRIECSVPAFQEVHRWKDRYKNVNIPAFPGYIFVRIEDCPSARLDVLRTRGVVRILGIGDTIERIPEPEIDAIRRLFAADVPRFAHPYVREGTRVRIRRGALKDVEGLLLRMKNQARLVLSINILSQSVATEVDLCDVEVLWQPAAKML